MMMSLHEKTRKNSQAILASDPMMSAQGNERSCFAALGYRCGDIWMTTGWQLGVGEMSGQFAPFFGSKTMKNMVFFNALSPKDMGEITSENEGNVASHSGNSPHLSPARLSRGGSLSKRQGLSSKRPIINVIDGLPFNSCCSP